MQWYVARTESGITMLYRVDASRPATRPTYDKYGQRWCDNVTTSCALAPTMIVTTTHSTTAK